MKILKKSKKNIGIGLTRNHASGSPISGGAVAGLQTGECEGPHSHPVPRKTTRTRDIYRKKVAAAAWSLRQPPLTYSFRFS